MSTNPFIKTETRREFVGGHQQFGRELLNLTITHDKGMRCPINLRLGPPRGDGIQQVCEYSTLREIGQALIEVADLLDPKED